MPTIRSFLEQQETAPSLIHLFEELSSACQDIASRLQNAHNTNSTGVVENTNVQGEQQKKMDVISNDIIKQKLLALEAVKGIASEEEEHPVAGHSNGEYYVLFDPLDGSSNLDINVSVGTIFSIIKAKPEEDASDEQVYLKPGHEQCAAGYFLYGPSTQLVFTTGSGTHQFSLNTDSGEFELTRENILIPNSTQEFAINMSNQRFWETAVQEYIQDLLLGEEGPIQKRFNMRWIASMVAEVHRILTRGGVFMYPKDSRAPEKPGKLRLMYEGNPMAFVVEQAQGRCSNARNNVLDIKPSHIHERVAIFLGSKEEVDRAELYHKKK